MEGSPPFNNGITIADFQDGGITLVDRLWLEINAIGSAIISADTFKKIGSILSDPPDFLQSKFKSSLWKAIQGQRKINLIHY